MEHAIGCKQLHRLPARDRKARRPAIRGVTLIELMVTIAVLGVLLAVGVPSFAALSRQWQQDAALDSFVGDLRLARSTATRMSRPVVVCAIDGTGACSGLNEWSTGWMVFSDLDTDGEFDAGEPVIAQRGAQAGIGSIAVASNKAPLGKVRFRGNGSLVDGSRTVSLVPMNANAPTRSIILNSIGRARVVKLD